MATTRKPIPNSLIVAAYVDERLSMQQCAARFGLSLGTIHRRLRESGVSTRPAHGHPREGSPLLDGAPSSSEDKAAYMKAWREKKRVEIAAYNKAYKEANKANLAESVRERSRRWYQENRQRALARDKAKYAANPDMKRANAAKSKAARRAKDEAIFKEKQAAYVRERRKGDARFALDGRMSNMVFYALRREKAGRSWKTLVDYTLDELVDRLNETMPDGYSWADFLSGELHIDHEIPRRAFNYTSPDDYDFKRCWALSNLRLLPREVNQKKGGRLSAPFQPSLL